MIGVFCDSFSSFSPPQELEELTALLVIWPFVSKSRGQIVSLKLYFWIFSSPQYMPFSSAMLHTLIVCRHTRPWQQREMVAGEYEIECTGRAPSGPYLLSWSEDVRLQYVGRIHVAVDDVGSSWWEPCNDRCWIGERSDSAFPDCCATTVADDCSSGVPVSVLLVVLPKDLCSHSVLLPTFSF